MQLAAAFLAAALAAPASVGVPPPAVWEAAVSSSGARVAHGLDHDEGRTSRARAPVAPPLRRLLRKRDVVGPQLPPGRGDCLDRSVLLLALDLDRTAASRLRQLRTRPEHARLRIRLVLAGILTSSPHRPPPTLTG